MPALLSHPDDVPHPENSISKNRYFISPSGNLFKLAGKEVQRLEIFLWGGLEVLRKSCAWQAHRDHDAAGAQPESGAGGVLC